MSIPSRATDEVALPSPPFVVVAGIPNFRDLGGYPVSSHSNHSVRREVIYRCGEPSQVTQDGISILQRLGITHAYDLRSNNEIERNKAAGRGDVVEWEGCERVFVPVFSDQDYSPENLAVRFKDYASAGSDGFTRAYDSILEGGPSAFRPILLHLAYEPEKPLIVHCTAGKDRTGVICAVILSLCGVEDDVVAHEYSLTEIGLPNEWKGQVMKHLGDNPALKGNLEGAKNMISARAVNMLATLKLLQGKFGGAERYVIEKCGLTTDEVENIRKNLIVEKPALHKKVQQNL